MNWYRDFNKNKEKNMSGVNRVQLLGRLGGDPELKYAPNGNAVCNFTVATSESWTDKQGQKHEKTEWSRIVIFSKLAELCNQYISKGSQVYVEGKIQTRNYDDKEGRKIYITEIVANNVQFLGSKKQEQTNSEQSNFTSSDIPF